jgi:hypothetical protein
MVKKKVKSKKELDGCCNLCDCEKDRTIKVYFCPKCRSKEVGYIFSFRSAFGLIPRMRCRTCGFDSIGFPQLMVSENKLKQMEKKK